MDTALIIDGHKFKEIHAVQYARENPYRFYHHQLICPCCREPVFFAHGSQKRPHFKHTRNSPIAHTCDRFVSNLSANSQSSSNQSPDFRFYLEKIGGSFLLFLALPKISASDIRTLSESYKTVDIGFTNRIYGNTFNTIIQHPLRDIKAEKYTLIPLTTLAYGYNISNISFFKLPSNWRSYGIMLPETGTLFHIYEGVGKHRSIADEGDIYLHTPYYLLINDSALPKTKDKFMHISTCDQINATKIQKLTVYKIEFTKLSQEAKVFATSLHVNLTDKPQEIIPLWPPMIEKVSFADGSDNKRFSYSLTHKADVFYAVENPDSISNPFLYNKCKITGKKQELHSSVGKKLVTADVVVHEGMNHPDYVRPTLSITWNNSNIDINRDIQLTKEKGKTDLYLSTDTNCTIAYTRNEFIKYLGTITPKQGFRQPDELTSSDKITIYHGRDIISELTVIFKRKMTEIDSDSSKIDLILYRLLTDKTDNYMRYPIQLKHILSRFRKYPKSYIQLKQMLKKGEITETAVRYITLIMKNMEVKHGL